MPFPPVSSVPNTPDATQVSDAVVTVADFGLHGFAVLALIVAAGFTISLIDPSNERMKRVLVGLYGTMTFGLLGWSSQYDPALMGVSVGVFLLAWVIGLNVGVYLPSDPQKTTLPNTNLEDEQIKRVVGMMRQGKCSEAMRQKLLDLATGALPRLLDRIAQHEAAREQLRSLHEKLPEHRESWSLAQQTVNERWTRLIARHAHFTNLARSCREQLDALEAIMLDDALMGGSSTELDEDFVELMSAVNEALADARHETAAHNELDELGRGDTIDLKRRRAAAARTPEHR